MNVAPGKRGISLKATTRGKLPAKGVRTFSRHALDENANCIAATDDITAMIPVTVFKDQTVALFGLGGSGLATAEALKAGGATVVAYDDSETSRRKAGEAGILVQDLHDIDWSIVQALVLAPGVPLTHPEPHWSVKLAQAAGVEIIGDIELFCRERQAIARRSPFVAITGTNGKSTTTALITHILRVAGRDVQMGGNIGTAILSLAPPKPGRVHVVECSSYQIDLAPGLDPSVGVMLNITPDHLDRHGTLENYAAVKERLVTGVEQTGTAVVGVDDDFSAAMADRTERAGKQVIRISVRRPLPDGIWLEGETLVVCEGGAETFRLPLGGIGSLRGAHNAQNAAAAYATCRALGVAPEVIAVAMKRFPGLAHRMEEVGKTGKVLFVNDSKATNADAAERALLSFSEGGRHRTPGALLRPHRQGLSHRRGRAGLRRDPGRRGAARDRGHPRQGGGSRRPRRRGVRPRRRGGAALPRLRQLRPVSEFRGAGRRLPHFRPGAARHRGPHAIHHAGGAEGAAERRGPPARKSARKPPWKPAWASSRSGRRASPWSGRPFGRAPRQGASLKQLS